MALNWLDIDPIDGGVSVNGDCDYGDLTPIMPGEYPWRVLKVLAGDDCALMAEIRSPLNGASYYLGSEGLAYPLQRSWSDRLFNYERVIGALRDSTAPVWFEKNECNRGFLVRWTTISALIDALSPPRPKKDLLNVAALEFELQATRNFSLKSRAIPETRMAEVALDVAREMKIPARFDAFRSILHPSAPKRTLIDQLVRRGAHDRAAEEESCKISSLLR